MPSSSKKLLTSLAIVVLGASSAACNADPGRRASGERSYSPVARTITITTVPLLVKEQERVLPFLKGDFEKGGMLDGKRSMRFRRLR